LAAEKSIYLIRHGETPGNRNRVVQLPETPLSRRGQEQARRLGQRLIEHPIAHIISSDLARADMTAQALASRSGLKIEYESLLQERNFGDIRGIAYDDLPENPFGPDYVPPGGESWEVFHRRVDACWSRLEALAADLDGPLAAVTHGLVLHSLIARKICPPPGAEARGDEDPPLQIGNTGLTIVEGPDPWQAVLLGCTAHLEEESDSLSGL
jgi:probable phosphoglycerate mutase